MEEQAILSLINQAYEQEKMFESILFEASNQAKLAHLVSQVSRFLYCQNHRFADDGCAACQRFNKNQVLDYQQVGDGLLAINKEALKTVLDDFATSAKGWDQPKVLVLANAENLKLDAANSLLKFLEEPNSNTYLFLLTTNKNQVLPTIKSRTKIFSLDEPTITHQDNFFLQVLQGKNPTKIMLLNVKLKKMSKEELVLLVSQSLPIFLEWSDAHLYQAATIFLTDLKFDANTNLAIDRFLIEASVH